MLIAEGAHEHARVDSQEAALSDLVAAGVLEGSAPGAILLAASARSRLRRGNWEEARTLLDRARCLTPSLTVAVPWLSVQTRLELADAFVALRDHAVRAGSPRGNRRDPRPAARPRCPRRTGRGPACVARHASRRRAWAQPGADRRRAAPAAVPDHAPVVPRDRRAALPSRNTIKTQAISVYRKLGVSTRSDAMDRALSLGLVDETVQARTLAQGPQAART